MATTQVKQIFFFLKYEVKNILPLLAKVLVSMNKDCYIQKRSSFRVLSWEMKFGKFEMFTLWRDFFVFYSVRNINLFAAQTHLNKGIKKKKKIWLSKGIKKKEKENLIHFHEFQIIKLLHHLLKTNYYIKKKKKKKTIWCKQFKNPF